MAPFALTTFEDATGWSGMIREVVRERRMPPWHADPSHGRFANDRSLPDRDMRTLLAWMDHGMPAGDVDDGPPAKPRAPEWRIGRPDVVFEMHKAIDIPADGQIPYQHTILNTKFREDKWIQAIEIQPGNREVVHHIMVFVLDPKTFELEDFYAEFDGGRAGYFALMVPGERPTVFPNGFAKRVPAGARLLLQLHYQPNGRPTRDRSRIGLVFAKEPVRHQVFTEAAQQDGPLVVPPDTERHVERGHYRFDRDTALIALTPHMHYRGAEFRYDVHYPTRVTLSQPLDTAEMPAPYARRLSFDGDTGELTLIGWLDPSLEHALRESLPAAADQDAITRLKRISRSETLLSIPQYDFGWQDTYRFADPKQLPAGTLLTVKAVFNNSSSNPNLTADMWSRPVRWGLQSTDEMMLGYFDYYYPDGTSVPQRRKELPETSR